MSVIAWIVARVPSARLSLYDICVSPASGLWNCAVYGVVYVCTREDGNCWEICPVTLCSNAFGNCIGLSGSSCGADSQVPGTLTTCTSGHAASCEAGRGLCGWGVADDGGRTPGGTALGGGDPGL